MRARPRRRHQRRGLDDHPVAWGLAAKEGADRIGAAHDAAARLCATG